MMVVECGNHFIQIKCLLQGSESYDQNVSYHLWKEEGKRSGL